jgi:hypothetical protein
VALPFLEAYLCEDLAALEGPFVAKVRLDYLVAAAARELPPAPLLPPLPPLALLLKSSLAES